MSPYFPIFLVKQRCQVPAQLQCNSLGTSADGMLWRICKRGLFMKMLRVVLVLVCCLFLLELTFWIQAMHSRHKAAQLLQTLDQFELGRTSKTEAESELRQVGLEPVEDQCSSVYSPCQGFSVGLANYPMPFKGETATMLEYVAGRISLFRPTYLNATCYYSGNELVSVETEFSTDRMAIGNRLDSTELGQEARSEWRLSNRGRGKTFVRILDHAHQQGTSLGSAKIFNLACMESFRGCNSDSDLWPTFARFKAE
jgi:hypothetical protein